MNELQDHLVRVQEISARARAHHAREASDPKAFSRTIVEDLAALADAVSELISRAAD